MFATEPIIWSSQYTQTGGRLESAVGLPRVGKQTSKNYPCNILCVFQPREEGPHLQSSCCVFVITLWLSHSNPVFIPFKMITVLSWVSCVLTIKWRLPRFKFALSLPFPSVGANPESPESLEAAVWRSGSSSPVFPSAEGPAEPSACSPSHQRRSSFNSTAPSSLSTTLS